MKIKSIEHQNIFDNAKEFSDNEDDKEENFYNIIEEQKEINKKIRLYDQNICLKFFFKGSYFKRCRVLKCVIHEKIDLKILETIY